MAWKEPYVKIQTVVINQTKRAVTVPLPFHPGQGDMTVYLNGVFAVPGEDYKELSSYTLEFTEDLMQGDTLTLHYQKLW